MNTQKHTQGPWRLEIDYPKGFLILKDEPHPSHDPVWTVANVNACMGAESKSNANLIAAAPEMLEALRISRGNVASLNAAHPAIWGEWLKVIDAAISKAEGGK